MTTFDLTAVTASAPGPAPTLPVGSERWAQDRDVQQPLDVPATLVPFVEAGVFGSAEVHVARALSRIGGDDRPAVLLGAALAVRAPRRQHVCADLATVEALVVEHAAGGPNPAVITQLPWPALDAWLAALADSPLVEVRDPSDLSVPTDISAEARPLTLAGSRLYLDRLWRDERLVARRLRDHAARTHAGVDPHTLAGRLDQAFADGIAPDRQRLAAARALLGHLTVIAGGPGTGKTTTVARILALLDDHARDSGMPLPEVALAAPTGKAAARLTSSLQEAATALAETRGEDDATVLRLRRATASTIHRLLGPRGDNKGRFLHDRSRPLPHDVIVIDETSMVSLPLVARLLEAVRRDARLIMLGDPEQLASVEAGSVLGDIVADAATTVTRVTETAHEMFRAAAGDAHVATLTPTADAAAIDDAIVVLDRVHRFREDSGIAAAASAIQRGDAEEVIEVLGRASDINWIDADVQDADLAPIREAVVEVAGAAIRAATDGDAATALHTLDELRILCAHRQGPAGVGDWVTHVEQWLSTDLDDADLHERWYLGRPVLVTRNDPRHGLANGDVGIVVRGDDERPMVALEGVDDSGPRLLAPARLSEVETVHAMTVHKSQGSQFTHVILVLPDEGSPLLTRELLYTALTRGRRRATVVGSPGAIRAAVRTRAVRASGLSTALRAVAPPGRLPPG